MAMSERDQALLLAAVYEKQRFGRITLSPEEKLVAKALRYFAEHAFGEGTVMVRRLEL